MYKFKFADIGEGLHEGKVAEIYKKVGDTVKEGDSLISVETDKVTSDIPSPVSGTITKMLFEQGDVIHVGNVIYHIDDGSGDDDQEEEVKEEKVEEAGASVVGEVKVSNKVVDMSAMKSSSKSSCCASSASKVRKGSTNGSAATYDGTLATPLARAIAAEKGIDISQVPGSGFNGRILVADVENFNGVGLSMDLPDGANAFQIAAHALKMAADALEKAEVKSSCDPTLVEHVKKQVEETKEAPKVKASKPAAKPIASGDKDKRTKVPPMRKAIANAMVTSWTNVAYTNLVTEVNMTELWNYRKKTVTPEFIEKNGVKPTFLAFIAKAVTEALKEFPMLNAKYDETTNEIVEFHDINVGIAVDTPKGLVVPVIKESNDKSVIDMAKGIVEVAVKARDGKLTAKDMSGGTFSITNYGSAGAQWGVPVINFPEIGILGVGTITDRVFADKDGNFYNGKVMQITTAADHRWVDGADVGRFNMKVKQFLEDPALFKM